MDAFVANVNWFDNALVLGLDLGKVDKIAALYKIDTKFEGIKHSMSNRLLRDATYREGEV